MPRKKVKKAEFGGKHLYLINGTFDAYEHPQVAYMIANSTNKRALIFFVR